MSAFRLFKPQIYQNQKKNDATKNSNIKQKTKIVGKDFIGQQCKYSTNSAKSQRKGLPFVNYRKEIMASIPKIPLGLTKASLIYPRVIHLLLDPIPPCFNAPRFVGISESPRIFKAHALVSTFDSIRSSHAHQNLLLAISAT